MDMAILTLVLNIVILLIGLYKYFLYNKIRKNTDNTKEHDQIQLLSFFTSIIHTIASQDPTKILDNSVVEQIFTIGDEKLPRQEKEKKAKMLQIILNKTPSLFKESSGSSAKNSIKLDTSPTESGIQKKNIETAS